MNYGRVPHGRMLTQEELEEERRMFYVGITRTRKELHLYAAKKIYHHDAEISRFLYEAKDQASSNSASSNSSSNFSSTASYSASSRMFSRDGLPSSSSK